MKGICHIWSRGRLISPSLPVGDDWYLNLSSQKRSPGRNLGEHHSVRRSGTASRGTIILVFCLRMRSFPRTEVYTMFLSQCSHRDNPRCQQIYSGKFISSCAYTSCLKLRIRNNTVHRSQPPKAVYHKLHIINLQAFLSCKLYGAFPDTQCTADWVRSWNQELKRLKTR